MCGRYSITKPAEALQRVFRFEGPCPNLPPRYNVAPTQDAPIVRLAKDRATRELAQLRWGLVPFWSDGPDDRYSMINARAETVRKKPAYRQAFSRRRCLVPADGFYEWKKANGGKQPYRIVPSDAPEGLMAFAGLWERWSPNEADGEPIESFTIVVTAANEQLAEIHDRMPVVLEPDDWDAWLTSSADDAAALLRPLPADRLEAYPVSKRVNNPSNDDPGCVEAVSDRAGA